jgi:hypothetical protein
MDDRGANIDLLFRNGLKDYEVLPPQEVWDVVRPAIKTRRSMVILRAAALLTALVSISFIAYMLSRTSVIAPGNEISEFIIGITDPVRVPSIENVTEQQDAGMIALAVPVVSTPEEQVSSISREDAILFPEVANTDGLYIPVRGRSMSQLGIISSTKNSMEVPEVSVPEFYPETQQPAKERWSVSAMASPTYYSRMGSGSDELINQIMSSEQPVLTYSGGFALSYKISKRFSIQTGFYYASAGKEIEGVNSFSGFDKYLDSKGSHNFAVLTSSGPVFTSNADVFLLADGSRERMLSNNYTIDVFDPKKASLRYIDNSIIQSFSYLQMPVMLRYKFIDKTLDFNLVGGLSSDLLIGNTAFAREGSDKIPIGTTKGLNSLIFSSSLGMGMEYNFSGKISLNFEPTLRYFLSPFGNSAGQQIHPYSFGVFSGFSFRF